MPNRPSDPTEPPFDPRYDPRDPRSNGYPDDGRAPYDDRYDPRDPRDARDPRDPRDLRDPRDPRGPADYDRRTADAPQWRDDDPRYSRSVRGGAMPPPPVSPRGPDYGGRDLPPDGSTRRRGRLPLWAILAGLVALVLVAFFAFGLTRGNSEQDRLDGNSLADGGTRAAATPAERCGAKQTYEQVKGELFRQAAATRGSDRATFDRLAAYATLRMEAPVLKRQDENVGTLVCSARAAIDLPPGVEVAGGRRTLTAALDYSLQNAADGSGQVVTLAGADPITVPLATLARSTNGSAEEQAQTTDAIEPSAAPDAQPSPPPVPAPAPPQSAPVPAPRPAPVPPRPAAPPVARPQPAPDVQASARPAFNCRYARTRGEIAVCGSPDLASLDRQMTSVYVRALRGTSPQTTALLHRTRDRFLAYRDRCGNEACMAGAYRDRIREINDIMEGRWQP